MPITRYDTVRRLEALIEILQGTSDRRLQNARRLAKEKVVQFEAILALSVDLGLVSINESTDAFTLRELSTDWREDLTTLALKSRGELKLALLSLLKHFSFNGAQFTYALRSNDGKIDSGARNLALEIGLLEYESETGQYSIPPAHLDEVLRFLSIHTAPSVLEETTADNLRLGLAAELAVVDFEVESLSKFGELNLAVVHEALSNASAGYDIRTWEPAAQTHPVAFRKKFIEVKAVSVKDFRFHWTRNEMEWAERLGSQYYLYLVPVIGKDKFDMQALEVIQDPYQHFFNRPNSWQREVELYSFVKQVGIGD